MLFHDIFPRLSQLTKPLHKANGVQFVLQYKIEYLQKAAYFEKTYFYISLYNDRSMTDDSCFFNGACIRKKCTSTSNIIKQCSFTGWRNSKTTPTSSRSVVCFNVF